jgi:hypothetical protein
MSLLAFSYEPEKFIEHVRVIPIAQGFTMIAAYNKNIIMIISKSILTWKMHGP